MPFCIPLLFRLLPSEKRSLSPFKRSFSRVFSFFHPLIPWSPSIFRVSSFPYWRFRLYFFFVLAQFFVKFVFAGSFSHPSPPFFYRTTPSPPRNLVFFFPPPEPFQFAGPPQLATPILIHFSGQTVICKLFHQHFSSLWSRRGAFS